MSRTKARKQFRAQTLLEEMAARGIYVRSVSRSGLTEEAGAAYKDIDDVVEAVHRSGISRRVVRLIPIGNVKG
jgi:tRNA-splicing ligase RtcB